MDQGRETVTAKERLIVLAAEILKGAKMPSEFYDDWDFRKTTPHADKMKAIRSARLARDQCREWATQIRKIVDEMVGE